MQVYDIHINQQMKETTQHGSFEFPFVIYETQLSKNVLGYVNWHWHNELQFCYIISGSIIFYVNQKGTILHAGQGIFVNGDVLHMIKPFKILDSTYVCVNVHPSLLYGFPGNIIEQKYIRPYVQNTDFSHYFLSPEISAEKQILTQLSKIYSLYSEHEYGYEFEIFISLLNVWKQLIMIQREKQPLSRAISELDSSRLKALLSLIYKRYNEKLTLKEFADEVYLCSSECCRFFKHHMGCTIFDYLIDYRIEKSINLLLFSDVSISQIAYDCGFGSTSYYIERFRKKTGKTPLEFRKEVTVSKGKNSI